MSEYTEILVNDSMENLETLSDVIKDLEQAVSFYKSMMEASQADEKQAVYYLQSLRDALEFDGDFPTLIEYARHLNNITK